LKLPIFGICAEGRKLYPKGYPKTAKIYVKNI